MLSFKDYLKEENNIGYEGTDKLTRHRKKMTPCQPMKTGDMLPGYTKDENKEKINK